MNDREEASQYLLPVERQCVRDNTIQLKEQLRIAQLKLESVYRRMAYKEGYNTLDFCLIAAQRLTEFTLNATMLMLETAKDEESALPDAREVRGLKQRQCSICYNVFHGMFTVCSNPLKNQNQVHVICPPCYSDRHLGLAKLQTCTPCAWSIPPEMTTDMNFIKH